MTIDSHDRVANIGEFRSINSVFKFTEDPKAKMVIRAKNGLDNEYVKYNFDPLCFNLFKFPITCSTVRQKVEFCLKNPHIKPAIDKKTNKVFFKTIAPNKKTWKDSNKFELCVSQNNMQPLSDGSILIWKVGSRFFNVWNPKSGVRKTLNSPSFKKFKNGKELENGFLAMLTENGSIEIWDWKNKKYIREIKFKDEKIIDFETFSENLIIIKSSDKLRVFDVSDKKSCNNNLQQTKKSKARNQHQNDGNNSFTIPNKIIQDFSNGVFKKISNTCFYKKSCNNNLQQTKKSKARNQHQNDGNNSFTIPKKNKSLLHVYHLNNKKMKFQREKTHFIRLEDDQVLEDYEILSNGNLLLMSGSKKSDSDKKFVKIFNPRERKYFQLEEVKDTQFEIKLDDREYYFDRYSKFHEIEIEIKNEIKKAVVKNSSTLGYIVYWDIESGKILKQIYVDSIQSIKLIDNSIAAGSNSQTIIFGSNRDKLDKDYFVKKTSYNSTLKELYDGSIAINSGDTIEVISPIRISKDEVKIEDLSIDELKARIKKHPHDFNSYDELAKKFADESDHKNEQHLYLLGLQEAFKADNKYRARRFYEKALELCPNNHTNDRQVNFHHFYLNFLDDFHDKKVKSIVYKNLFKLCPDEDEYLNEYKKLRGKKYKKRLIVGDGNFTFTEDLINQHIKTHPDLAKSIVSTEITDERLTDENVIKRVQKLTKKGVKIFFDVDATKINERFKNKRFSRIHWNCPFGGSGPIPGEIEKFFISASHLQKPFDRVHMTLAQELKLKEERQGYDYKIVKATTLAGYRLIRKREFSSRFSNYEHVSSGENKPYRNFIKKEFVFEKIPQDEYVEKMNKNSPYTKFLSFANSLKNPEEKNYEVKFEKQIETKLGYRPLNIDIKYFDCSTDGDTTDYFESDSDSEEMENIDFLSGGKMDIQNSINFPNEEEQDSSLDEEFGNLKVNENDGS